MKIIKKFLEYTSYDDGTSEDSLLSKMEKNNKTLYESLLPKVKHKFDSVDALKKHISKLADSNKDVLEYLLLNEGKEYNNIYLFKKTGSYFSLNTYTLSESISSSETKYMIYHYDSTGSSMIYDILSSIDDSVKNDGEVESDDNQKIVCENCGWSWFTKDSDESDKYVCHKCNHDNSKKYI